MAPELKRYIHEVKLDNRLRTVLVFSDTAKIRMYTDDRFGVRLRGTWDKNANRLKFPLDLDLTVELPLWNPDSVKGWMAFEELSDKPEGTTVGWRVSDGTDTYWWDGGAWAVVTPLDTEWNTEVEVSENLPDFGYSAKAIKLIANLRTTDDSVTPVLRSYRLMMQAQFDYWEDLVLRTVRRKVAESFDFPTNYSARLTTATDTFNYMTEDRWIPEQELDIIGVDAIYNEDSDPNHFTDILSSVNTGTGEVILTASVSAGTRLFVRYLVRPKVVVNFPNTDHYQVGETPEIIIEIVTGVGRQVEASRWMADKARNLTYKMGSPKRFGKVTFNCIVWTGSIVDSMRLMSAIDAFTTGVGTIQSKALDIPYTLREQGGETYNPTPNPTDLKQSSFQFIVEDFYTWPIATADGYPVLDFKYTINRRRDVGPTEEFGVISAPLPAGAIPTLYNKPDIEEG